ncbi:MAG: response regulator transcription factor [Bacteroidales bacterium]|nr:response regulator transcription factor [Bacteroidales bacterium]
MKNKKKRPVIVIAEDDSDMLNFLNERLSLKYNVLKALNGKDAWHIVQKTIPHMVLSDILMPGMDGNELCRLIKTTLETSHIPVILLTARVGDDNIIHGYKNRADRYITKPFSLDVLEAQIEQLLDTRKKLIDLFSKKILLKPKDITITSLDEKYLSKLMQIIEENISNSEFDVNQVVNKMNMSHSAVLKKIKALTDLSLVDFIRNYRLKKAAMILEKEKLPISEVAYMVGFSDAKYFSKCFSKQFGKTPTEFLNDQGEDMKDNQINTLD